MEKQQDFSTVLQLNKLTKPMSYYTVATVSQCDASREWFIQHFRHHQMVHPHFFFYTTAL